MNKRHNGGAVIIFSFIIAYMLTAMPLPEWALNWRPAWVTIVLIYWCMAIPQRVSIGIGWTLGLLLDVQQGTVFGQNAIALTIIAWIIVKLHQRIRVFPLVQQALLVCVLLWMLLLLLRKDVALHADRGEPEACPVVHELHAAAIPGAACNNRTRSRRHDSRASSSSTK